MSNWRAEIEDIEEPSDLVGLAGRYYHLPAVLILLGFMFWSRARHWKRFVVDGTVFFPGNDPWYHYRTTAYTVRNWPEASPFDPWTYFPFGTNSGQFGTIFDQLAATAALIVGLGNPSDHTIRMVLLFTPVVFGTAAAIPTYYIGKRVGGRLGGVTTLAVLALVGSGFASRATVGTADHQIAEAFFQIVAVLTTMVAVSVAEEEKPIYELFVARDLSALRRPVGWAILAGFAIALYIWSWPPGVLLLGILGIYYLVELSAEYAHGESPEHVAIVGAISLSVAGVLTLAALEEGGLSPTGFTFLQPGLAFAVAGGCVFMAWLARQWDARDLEPYQYPVGVAGIIVVLAGAVALFLPGLFDFFTNQITRVAGLGFFTSETAGTVGEAQPLPAERLYAKYRFTVFVAGVGAAYVVAKQFLSRTRAEMLLLVVWLAMAVATTLTQRRFDYYLAAPVAVMTGLVIGRFASFANLTATAEDIETYQVITVVAVALLVFAPLVFPSALAMQTTNAGVGQAPPAWNETLGWMEDNTPHEGEYGGADNAMEYYGTFEKSEDYDYPDGAYGVISWWDYGHWITVMGERIPTANPFQQGANEAANFLLSTNESRANTVLDRLEEDDGTETRYVMVDWKMVYTMTGYQTGRGTANLGGKYFAPFAFYDDSNINPTEYYQGRPYDNGILYSAGQQGSGQFRSFPLKKQPYYESTAVRLYRFHGSSIQPRPLVMTWERRSIQGQTFRVSTGVRDFRGNMTAAREFAEDNVTAQVGGFGPYPQERVPAMEHYRLVQVSDTSARDSQRYLFGLSKVARGGIQANLFQRSGSVNEQVFNALHRTEPAWVKAFERVPGATIEGQGPPNATVRAGVEMEVPGSNSTFTYRQRTTTGPDGSFTMTVPYSTTGYDDPGTDEGYTSPRVRATGPYRFQTGRTLGENLTVVAYNGTAHVPEENVVGVEDSPITVELERQVVTDLQNDGSGNETASGDSGDGASDGQGTGDLSPPRSVSDSVTVRAEP